MRIAAGVVVCGLLPAGCGSGGDEPPRAASGSASTTSSNTDTSPAADTFAIDGQLTITGKPDNYGIDSSTADPKTGLVQRHPLMPEQHHPWKRLRDELPDWHVEFVTLPPGVAGETDHYRKVISIGRHLDQRGRRSTLTHEALHVAREHLEPTDHDDVDVDVEQMAAIILMPIGRLLEVLVWAQGSHEADEELWVDRALFLTRMQHLGPPERRAIDQVLAARDYYATA